MMNTTNKTPLTKSFAFSSILAAITLLFAFSSADSISFSTGFLTLSIDRQGNIAGIKDKTNSKDYFPSGEKASLLSLYKDSVYIKPSSMDYNEGKNRITLRYPNGSVAVISALNKDPYLRFELISLSPRNGVQAVVWGPYPTTIRKSIGETICVVHDDHFAFGMQGLNINTIEGLPEGNDNSWGGSFIEPLPGQVLPPVVMSLKTFV